MKPWRGTEDVKKQERLHPQADILSPLEPTFSSIEMNSTTKGISICLLWTFGSTQWSKGQVIVTDIEPDQVYETSGDTCSIDLNNDGVDDLLIIYWKASSGECECPDGLVDGRPSSVRVIPLSGTSIGVDQSGRALALDSLQVIDQGLTWVNTGPITMAQTGTYCQAQWGCIPSYRVGDWCDNAVNPSPDRFLSARLATDSGPLYGWVQGVVPYYHLNLQSFILRAYAYNPTPMAAIYAGSTTAVGVEGDSFAPLVTIGPNPCSAVLFIHTNDQMSKVNVRILKLTGEEVLQLAFTDQTESTEVDIAHLASGAYLVEILSDHSRHLQKVMKY